MQPSNPSYRGLVLSNIASLVLHVKLEIIERTQVLTGSVAPLVGPDLSSYLSHLQKS